MRVRLCIPHVGTELQLVEDWNVKLHFEDRNETLFVLFNLLKDNQICQHFFTHCLQTIDKHLHALNKQDGKIAKKDDEPDSRFAWRLRNEAYPGVLPHKDIMIPKGTVLKIDRMYLRKGKNMENFDSVSFKIGKWGSEWLPPAGVLNNKGELRVVDKVNSRKLVPRFWAKLKDVNNIVADINMETVPDDGISIDDVSIE